MITIKSAGTPPERHADRVVAAMMRRLAERRAAVGPALLEVHASAKDGNPKSQQKLADRLRRAGAVKVNLKPGKRGRYSMVIYEKVGWDPGRDAEITLEDPIPEKPWVAWFVTYLNSRGRYQADVDSYCPLMITHHAMSRAAQRLGLRDEDHLDAATEILWNVASRYIGEVNADLTKIPPAGIRLPLEDGSLVVLKLHESRKSLVAATILSGYDEA